MEKRIKTIISYLPLLRSSAISSEKRDNFRAVCFRTLSDSLKEAASDVNNSSSHTFLNECFTLALLSHLHPLFSIEQRRSFKKHALDFERTLVEKQRRSPFNIIATSFKPKENGIKSNSCNEFINTNEFNSLTLASDDNEDQPIESFSQANGQHRNSPFLDNNNNNINNKDGSSYLINGDEIIRNVSKYNYDMDESIDSPSTSLSLSLQMQSTQTTGKPLGNCLNSWSIGKNNVSPLNSTSTSLSNTVAGLASSTASNSVTLSPTTTTTTTKSTTAYDKSDIYPKSWAFQHEPLKATVSLPVANTSSSI